MYALPEDITITVQRLVEDVPLHELKAAFRRVSDSYRSKTFAPFKEKVDRLAYLLFRLPATYAVGREVFSRLIEHISGFVPKTILDIGSGPGTMLLSIRDSFGEYEKAYAIEQDSVFISLAAQLAGGCPIEWLQSDVLTVTPSRASVDLAVMSYSLGEMNDERRKRSFDLALGARAIVIIEPGTPTGYQTVMQARSFFIAAGYRVVAPCPHSYVCPMMISKMTTSDWCHFYCRLPRSKEHKLLKEGLLGYEDEKFSYCILSKEGNSCRDRILREPVHRSGHSHFVLCSEDGHIKEATISRRSPLYKLAKKARWGDAISYEDTDSTA